MDDSQRRRKTEGNDWVKEGSYKKKSMEMLQNWNTSKKKSKILCGKNNDSHQKDDCNVWNRPKMKYLKAKKEQ